MRIAFSGTGNSGKSETIKSFLYTWKQYKQPEKTYRDILEEEKLDHSTKTSKDTQIKILKSLIEQVEGYTVDDFVVHDRCPLDNIGTNHRVQRPNPFDSCSDRLRLRNRFQVHCVGRVDRDNCAPTVPQSLEH